MSFALRTKDVDNYVCDMMGQIRHSGNLRSSPEDY